MLEAGQNRDNAYITLTYDDEHLPRLADTGIPTLEPMDYVKWLKRLRKALPFKIRFFLVGEYGGIKHRPHFHAIIFGMPSCRRGRTLRLPGPGNQPTDAANCCSICKLILKTWTDEKGKPIGLIDADQVNFKVARYVARYVVKKYTGPAEEMYAGRYPEFARMSLKNGGIGSGVLPAVAKSIQAHGLDDQADVPRGLRHGHKVMPLDKYLRRKLRVACGRNPQCPDEVTHALSVEMLPLLETSVTTSKSLKALVLERDEQKIRNIETKAAIFKSREKL